MALVVAHAGEVTAAELARRLGKGYFTVAQAVQRVRGSQLRYALTWAPCPECGQPIPGPLGRILGTVRYRRGRSAGTLGGYGARFPRTKGKPRRGQAWPTV